MNLINSLIILFTNSIFIETSIILLLLNENNNNIIYPICILLLNIISFYITIRLILTQEYTKLIFINYIPFLNVIASLIIHVIVIKIVPITIADDNNGGGLLLLLYSLISWVLYIISITIGLILKRKSILKF
jgi:hypothetical protein